MTHDVFLDEILDTTQGAAEAHLSPSTMNKKRLDGSGPVFLKIGRAVRYRRRDIRAWLEKQTRNSTSEYVR